MKDEKTLDLDTIVFHLEHNAKLLRYGTASVSLKIHDRTIVAVSHEIVSVTKEKETIK